MARKRALKYRDFIKRRKRQEQVAKAITRFFVAYVEHCCGMTLVDYSKFPQGGIVSSLHKSLNNGEYVLTKEEQDNLLNSLK